VSDRLSWCYAVEVFGKGAKTSAKFIQVLNELAVNIKSFFEFVKQYFPGLSATRRVIAGQLQRGTLRMENGGWEIYWE